MGKYDSGVKLASASLAELTNSIRTANNHFTEKFDDLTDNVTKLTSSALVGDAGDTLKETYDGVVKPMLESIKEEVQKAAGYSNKQEEAFADLNDKLNHIAQG